MFEYFSWSVAVRQLRYGITQTLLTIGVVAASVTLVIFITSLISGVQKRLISDITGSIPHIVISQPQRLPIAEWEVPSVNQPGTLYIGRRRKLSQQKNIEDWAGWVPRLQTFDPDVAAVSPEASGQAILSAGAATRGVQVIGVFPELYNQVVDIQSKLVRGQFLGIRTGEVVIGYRIVDDMDIQLNDKVRISTPDGTSATFTVVGVFNTGAQNIDEGTVYVTLRDAQSLFGLGAAVTSIGVKLKHVFNANNIADKMALQVPYKVDSWMRENQQLLSALRTQTQASLLIVLFTTVASGFGIASILITAVTSKLREIGILRAIGARRRHIISLFTIQSTLMAALGAVVGAMLGSAVSIGLYRLRVETTPTGPQAVFPVDLSWRIIGEAMLIALVVGFVASLYPAWRAARVDPIEVIRGA